MKAIPDTGRAHYSRYLPLFSLNVIHNAVNRTINSHLSKINIYSHISDK